MITAKLVAISALVVVVLQAGVFFGPVGVAVVGLAGASLAAYRIAGRH